jgi:hypothetical protein
MPVTRPRHEAAGDRAGRVRVADVVEAAGAAHDDVVAGSGLEPVLPGAAVETVPAVAADDEVTPAPAAQPVVAAASPDDVDSASADDDVATPRSAQAVVASRADDGRFLPETPRHGRRGGHGEDPDDEHARRGKRQQALRSVHVDSPLP